MADGIPADFDPDWYRANYPDVALSGLDPREHYRRFGRLMGRSVNGRLASLTRLEDRSGSSSDSQSMNAAETDEVALPIPAPRQSPPIINRPANFDPAQVVPASAPARSGRDVNEPIGIEALAEGPFAADCRSEALLALRAYARLFELAVAAEGVDVACGVEALQIAGARIQNAWFPDRSTLRLMLAGASDAGTASSASVLRIYQAKPASPNELFLVGPGIQLPTFGPAFHDLPLLHPLMPLLLELSDDAGLTRAMALIPFPSLLTGGLHYAELRALQAEANPMDDFWALSGVLLHEAVGDPQSPDRSISSVAVECASIGAETGLTSELEEWLAAVFDLKPAAERPSKTLRFSTQSPTDGLELTLPSDCIPTISSLVSRRLETGAGPYLVSDADTYRPRWSIVLPAANEPWTNIPVVRPVAGKAGREDRTSNPSVHLAIALRRPKLPLSGIRSSAAKAAGLADEVATCAPMSIILDVSDASRTGALMQEIREAAGDAAIEFLVRFPAGEDVAESEFDRICGKDGWSAIPRHVDLRDVAKVARNETLLSLSDRVRFDDSSALSTLCSLLQHDAAAGSVSCVLFAEKVIKKEVVLQPATGGLFPSGVSFSSAPRLSFAEPDVLEALPNLTYPVVANTLPFTLFRRSALAGLPRSSAYVPAAAADIRLGLDLMEAGFRNWCTTHVAATLSGPHVRRDCIDPFGGSYVHPSRWADILSHVTLVRELF